MGFTTPAFIRKNTPELRKRLEALGYKPLLSIEDGECLSTTSNLGHYHSIRSEQFDNKDPYSTYDCAGRIDCGANEDLFLAIAALRDDTNKNQWFVADSPLSVSYDDIVGNDHYFIEPKGSVFFWDINWMHATIISGNYHKATVEELIEHFKGKGVNHG